MFNMQAFFCFWVAYFSTSHSQSISHTNSSGRYLSISSNLSISNGYNEHQYLVCNNSIFCYVRGRDIDYITISIHSESAVVDCNNCDSWHVYSEVNNLLMMFNSSRNGIFHLEKVTNINITLSNVGYSTIYAQYAKTVNVLLAASNNKFPRNSRNTFYLDNVSNRINFECDPTYSDCLRYSTISAANANYFNLFIPIISDIRSGTAMYQVYIYCPSQAADVCNFDIVSWIQLKYVEIFLSDMNVSNNSSPLYFQIDLNYTRGYYYNDPLFTIWCNHYHSNTDIYYNSNNIWSCTNISSECCIFNNDRNNILCPHHTNCFVNCTITDCTNNNIYPSHATNSLYVICESMNCYDTIINCPTTFNSLCYVSCDIGDNSCYKTVIKYNTNNKDVYLNCIHQLSCALLQIFIDDITDSINVMSHLHINCSYCESMSLVTNAIIDNLTFICDRGSACDGTSIFAPLVKNIQMKCLSSVSCNRITVYPKSDSTNVVNMYCAYPTSCQYINFNIPMQYNVDYLSINGNSNACSQTKTSYLDRYYEDRNDISATCDYSGQKAFFESTHNLQSNDVCQCIADSIFCCPFSNSYGTIQYCDDYENCDVNLIDNNHGTIVYANKANVLSVYCQNCSYVNIFANNVTTVNIECVNSCNYIHLNGLYVELFNLKCSTHCADLVIDVMNAKKVSITADNMGHTEIYASKADNFSFICSGYCSYLELVIPSTFISITCENECHNILFYSYTGSSDLMKANICQVNDFEDWTFYCISPIKMYESIPDECISKSRLSHTFCECEHINYLNNTFQENTHIAVIPNPFIQNCRGSINDLGSIFYSINITLSITLTIYVVIVIAYYLVIYWKQIFFKYSNSIKYHTIVNDRTIEPPSKNILLYIYFTDLLIWILQICIITILWLFYKDSDKLCDRINSDQEFNDDDVVCSMISQCVWDDDNCIVHTSIYTVVLTMTIGCSIAVLLIFFVLCSTVENNDWNSLNTLTHFVCIGCVWDTRCNSMTYQRYLERHFFKFKRSAASSIFVIIIITRYILFFVLAFMICFSPSFDDLGIEWYFILPILILIILSESIKIKYKRLPSYDTSTHIKYILEQMYGEHMGYIIWSFLVDNIPAVANSVDETELQILKETSHHTETNNIL